jgi:hypothetical protein
MNSIVLLSGPIGAGKTTVARELVAGASGPTVYIEAINSGFSLPSRRRIVHAIETSRRL